MKWSTKRHAVLLGAVAVASVGLFYGCHRMVVTDMDEDERLYRAKCASCHKLVDPATRTTEQWRALLEHHGPRLTEAQRSAILNHLADRARTALHDDGNIGL